MLLNNLIDCVKTTERTGYGNPEITGLAYDSRNVGSGDMFVCIRGEKFDGHEFIGDVVARGASAIVIDKPECAALISAAIPVVVVPDTRVSLPLLANRLYDYPSRKLKLVGVTGTKGKTTTTYLIESIIRASGRSAGVIGTLGARINGVELPLDRTTPESADLQRILAQMVSDGVAAAAMEVSSHALIMGRTAGCEFDVGVFTNLTHDHLDFHKTMEEYLQAKMLLFNSYPGASSKAFTAVVNLDDPCGVRVLAETKGRAVTCGIGHEADIRASNIIAGANSVSFDVTTPIGACKISLNLGGAFNVHNALAAFGAGMALGISIEDIQAGLQALSAVPGRFESVDCGQEFGVIVDYAHTPDSLENVLNAARKLTSKRLIAVFGCGGDRDRAKRPKMGAIGAELADICIVTSDNPRSEDPQFIIDEVLAGTLSGRADVLTTPDRKEAILQALDLAAPDDLVVIAGKGHETYQVFRDGTIHFDDREVVREALGCSTQGEN